MSQPATKIFLRTSEPRAAKWIADSIGDIEVERLRESRSEGRRGQHSYGLERHVEPLVMASEVEGLPALRGFLKTGNLVVRLRFPFVDVPNKHLAFVERIDLPNTRPNAPADPTPEARETVIGPMPAVVVSHEPVPSDARQGHERLFN